MSKLDGYTIEESEVESRPIRRAISSTRIACMKEIRGVKFVNALLGVLLVAMAIMFALSRIENLDYLAKENKILRAQVSELETTEVVSASATPMSGPTSTQVPVVKANPTTTSTPDRWSEVRGCEIEAVYFQVSEGPIEKSSQQSWAAAPGRYEIWAVALFGNADPNKYQKDQWKNPVLYQISGDKMSLEGISKFPVRVYSPYGLVGTANTGGESVSLFEKLYCKPLEQNANQIVWTDVSSLRFLTEVRFSPGNGYASVSRFYMGRPMTDEEIRAVFIAGRHNENFKSWYGIGLIGAGVSGAGTFNIAADGTLTAGIFGGWNDLKMGVKIPKHYEVVVATSRVGKYVTARESVQRFVWTDMLTLEPPSMIEQVDTGISAEQVHALLKGVDLSLETAVSSKEIPAAPVTTVIPTPTPSAEPSCVEGTEKWLPVSGNPSTAAAVWDDDYTLRVLVVGPEIRFEAFVVTSKRDDKGLGAAVRQYEFEKASYLIVCHGARPELRAIKLDGKQIWPVLANPTAIATPAPIFTYPSVNPRTREVRFESGVVENVSERIPGSKSYASYVVATCSYQDLEAIKKILNNAVLEGQWLTFELVGRWGQEFLVGVGYGAFPVEYRWKVCPEWFDGGGF